jgi:WhiB family transcriptional regulator, redox-sensing transcriptional regulator
MSAETTIASWRNLAGCLGMDAELWFPLATIGAALEQIQRAKAVCRRRPVTAQCLA